MNKTVARGEGRGGVRASALRTEMPRAENILYQQLSVYRLPAD